MAKHIGAKMFTCKDCDFQSNHRASIHNHIKEVHTSEMKYSCDLCMFKSNLKYKTRKRATTADKATDNAIYFARLIKENSENTRVRNYDDKVIESEEEQVPGEKDKVEENSETEPLPNPVSLSTIPNPVSLSTLPNPEAGTPRRFRSFSSRESREPPRESRESRDDTRRFRPRSRSASQHRGRFRSRYDKGRREQSEEMLADVLTKDSVKNTELHDTVKYGSLPKNISDISETESGKFVRDPRS